MSFRNNGGRPSQPIFNSPPVVTWMIGSFVGVWLVLDVVLPASLTHSARIFLEFIPMRLGIDFPSRVPHFLLSMVTYQFLHGDFAHLAFNSIWMLIFGTIVARRLERVSFLVFFFVCGAIGAVVHLLFAPGSAIPVVGASGAIAGLMGAAGRFAIFPPEGGLHVSMHASHSQVVPLSDRRLQAFGGVWIVLNLVFGLGAGFGSGGGQLVAWDIHIAGLIAGLLLFPRFDAWRRPPHGGSDDGNRRGSHLRRVK